MSHDLAQYFRTQADFLQRDLTAEHPDRVAGALARIRRAIPRTRQMSDADLLSSLRHANLLEVVAFEQRFQNWAELKKNPARLPVDHRDPERALFGYRILVEEDGDFLDGGVVRASDIEQALGWVARYAERQHGHMSPEPIRCDVYPQDISDARIDRPAMMITGLRSKVIGWDDGTDKASRFTCAQCDPDEPHPDVDYCGVCRPSPATRTDAASECGRCGSQLDHHGFCRDITCPYSDYKQTVPYSAITHWPLWMFLPQYAEQCRKDPSGFVKMEYRRHYSLLEEGSGLERVRFQEPAETGWYEVVERCYDREINPDAAVYWVETDTKRRVTDPDLLLELNEALELDGE